MYTFLVILTLQLFVGNEIIAIATIMLTITTLAINMLLDNNQDESRVGLV